MRKGEVGRWPRERRTRWRGDVEKGLEVGVIQEPLPVYTRNVERGETRLEMGVVR
jgi:hypothetical protein